MKTTYLKDPEKFKKKGLVYVPLGTIEWHGSHLPVETDFLVAQKLCEILAKKRPGYILPPVYLGTDRERMIGGKKWFGMDARFRKKLPGSLYLIKPTLLKAVVTRIVENLEHQGFMKIIILTGHASSKQIETLRKVGEEKKSVIFLNPFEKNTIEAQHADEYETSLFWACYPEEEARGRAVKVAADDDFFKYRGYDVRGKASIEIGKKMLREIVDYLSEKISA